MGYVISSFQRNEWPRSKVLRLTDTLTMVRGRYYTMRPEQDKNKNCVAADPNGATIAGIRKNEQPMYGVHNNSPPPPPRRFRLAQNDP